MSGSCFAERLGDFLTLTPAEHGALEGLEERVRPLRRGTVLVRENDPHGELFILKKGMMMSYLLLPDGSRQILRFLFPGDMIAASAMVYRDSPETVVALTDSAVCPFDRGAMAALVTEHPRLAAVMMVLTQMERVALTDRLAALGRTSAKARVAAVLLEIRYRMRPAERTTDDSFVLGLTQEEIGDATGLTAVHVNRMMRQLQEDGVIGRTNGRVHVVDEARLAAVANHIDRFATIDTSWLPTT